MSEVKEIKKSLNKVQIVGEISELNIKEETKETNIKGMNGKEQKVTCGVIEKADFKSGAAITIKVEPKDEDGKVRFSETVGVDFYPVKEKKFDKDGNIVDNPRYKAFKTIMQYTKGTRVFVDGSILMNEYASSKDGINYDYHSIPQVNVFNITSTNVPNDDMVEGYISGVIRNIAPETKGEDAEETGRYKVELYFFDSKGDTTPNTFIVPKEIAETFNDLYESAQSVKLDYEIVSRSSSGTKKSKQAFGRESQVKSGYTVTEYQIFGGDEPFEEENELYVNMSQMKQAMATRQNLIDTTIDNKKKEDKEGVKSSKSKSLSDRASKVKEELENKDQDEDMPF